MVPPGGVPLEGGKHCGVSETRLEKQFSPWFFQRFEVGLLVDRANY
jgi:hypothetical protein